MKSWVPDAITASRLIASVLLLAAGGLDIYFLVIYCYCGISDLADGYVARKYDLCTEFGSAFDSVTDFVLVLAMLAVLIPAMPAEPWMIYFIIIIAFFRILSFSIASLKFRRPVFLHTKLNKIAGAFLRVSPVFMLFADLGLVVAAVCTVSLAGALEELAINIKSEELNPGIRTFRDLQL